MSWQPVIGLEIHAQLSTQSKLFSGASTAYGAEPNTQAALLDVAMPGTLPVPNRAALDKAIAFGLAVNATIARRSVFARKNYFYPDLPKGYQISQYELPIVADGRLAVHMDDGRCLKVEIQRAHLEEDAGKSLHDAFHAATGLDFNRSGVPLLEIVSAPVLHSAHDAVAYMRAVHTLVRWLGVCDGNMAEGSFRCDANVSVRRTGTDRLGTRTEIKNVNSFRFVEKAIEYEIERQIRALENGEAIVQETRLYDAAAHRTLPMRGKEDADDYRYFPDPDLPPLVVSDADIEAVRAALPELPEEKRTSENKVMGCASQVWLVTHTAGDPDNPVMSFEGDSDAHIVRGLVAIVLATYSGKTASEIAGLDAFEIFSKIGLVENLSSQRSNGLRSMVNRIREEARVRAAA